MFGAAVTPGPLPLVEGLATCGMVVAQGRAGPGRRTDDDLPKVVKTLGPVANKHAVVLIYRSSCI